MSHKHLGPPVRAGETKVEREVAAYFHDAATRDKTRYRVAAGKFDVNMPVLLHGAKFVFSPNGIGEQCYRERAARAAPLPRRRRGRRARARAGTRR